MLFPTAVDLFLMEQNVENLQFQEVVKAILLLVVNKLVTFGSTNYTSSIMTRKRVGELNRIIYEGTSSKIGILHQLSLVDKGHATLLDRHARMRVTSHHWDFGNSEAFYVALASFIVTIFR